MKKLNFLLPLVMVFATVQMFAQSIYTNDFESYTAGTGIAAQDETGTWSTWSGTPGSAEDALVTEEAANEGTKSIAIQSGTDAVLLLNDLTQNRYRVEFYLMVPEGKVGYYNILQDFAEANSKWGMQLFFKNGVGSIDGNGEAAATFNFNHGEWLKIQHFIDLDNDWIDFYINDELVHAYQWSLGTFGSGTLKKLDAFNFYGWDDSGNATPGFYMDDYLIEQVAVPNPPQNLNANVTGNDVELTWEAPSEGTPESYAIVRDGKEVAVVEASVNSYSDAGLYPRTYKYELKAFYGNSIGYSSSVGPVEATVAGGVERNFTLMEIFTGTWCVNCPSVAVAAELISEETDKVAVIEYHGGDDYEIPGSASRQSYYGVDGFPTTMLDGEIILAGGGDSSHAQDVLSFMKTKQDVKIATPSVMTLNANAGYVSEEEGENTINLNITVEEINTYYGDNLYLHIALTESNIEESWFDQSHLHFVARKMLPDGNGVPLDFSSGTTQTFTQQLELQNDWNKEECEIIIFIQDNDTKEIVQTAKIAVSDVVYVGVNEALRAKVSMYPNPVKNQLSISANNTIQTVEVLTLSGQMMLSQNFNKSAVKLNTSELADGVYILKINTNNGLITKKIVK